MSTKSAARKIVTKQDRIDSLNEQLTDARQAAGRAREAERQAESARRRAEWAMVKAERDLSRARREASEAVTRQQDLINAITDEQRIIERFTGQPEDMAEFVEQAAQRGALIRANLGELIADVTPAEADRALNDTGSMATFDVLAMVQPDHG